MDLTQSLKIQGKIVYKTALNKQIQGERLTERERETERIERENQRQRKIEKDREGQNMFTNLLRYHHRDKKNNIICYLQYIFSNIIWMKYVGAHVTERGKISQRKKYIRILKIKQEEKWRRKINNLSRVAQCP